MRALQAFRHAPTDLVANLVDKGRSLIRLRARYAVYAGTVRGGDRPISVAYFGNGANLPFVLATVFGERPAPRQAGAARIWQASAFSRSRSSSADLTVFDMPWPWEMSFPEDSRVIEIPAWIRQAVALPRDRESFYASLHRSVRGEQMRKIRKYGLMARVVHDVDEIRRFYRDMYVPHVRRRFGPDATIAPEPRVVKYAQQGALLQVLREGRVVAGSVLYRRREIVQSLWSGFAGEDLRALDGATAALFYHLAEFAFDHGCRTIDYCGSRPLLSDGVFETKRRWGGAVHDDWSLESLLLQFNDFGAGVRQLLQRCPWIARQDGSLVGKVLADASPLTGDVLEKQWLRLACPGLRALHVYAPGGIAPGARETVDRSGAPVTLFDLRQDADPLKSYCDC